MFPFLIIKKKEKKKKDIRHLFLLCTRVVGLAHKYTWRASDSLTSGSQEIVRETKRRRFITQLFHTVVNIIVMCNVFFILFPRKEDFYQ